MRDPMPLAEAIELVGELAETEGASHYGDALRTLLAYAEAWAWCAERNVNVDVWLERAASEQVQIYVDLGSTEVTCAGPDLPAAVAAARAKLEASR